MATGTNCSDFGAQEKKVCHCFHCFSIYLPWSDGTRCHDLSFWNVEFKPTFSLSFTFIKRLFSSSSISAVRVVSSAYLRLPFPSPGDLPHPGIESWSPALHADSLLTELPGKPIILCSAKKEKLLINYDRSLSFRIFTLFLFKSSFG